MLAKSYKNISNKQISKAKLLKLNFHILMLRYLEKRVSCFIELLFKNKDKKGNKANQKHQYLIKKKKIKKNVTKREKKKPGYYLSCSHLSSYY